MRNRWGVEIKKGYHAWYRGGRNGTEEGEGKIISVDRSSDYAKAYGPLVTIAQPDTDVHTRVSADAIYQVLPPMKLKPGGIVTANPTPRLDRYDQPSQREHVTPKGKRTKRPSERLKARRVKTHYAKTPGVWANPLVRVKVKSPAQRGKGEPSPRLVQRRKTTQKAPAGFYANPRALAPYKSAEVMKSNGGFEFGMDAVTPVSWEFTTLARARKGAYVSFKLPAEVVGNADFQAWARGNGGRVIMSKRELVAKIKQLARV